MKIGLLTHYNVNNQGAQLQMLSMKKLLEHMGHEIYILSYQKDFSFDQDEEKKNSASFLQFPYYIKEYLLKKGVGLTLFNTRKALRHKAFSREFQFLPYDTDLVDCIIIGSDEVFSIDVGCNKMMYGHGLKAPAIAYAPSFGRSTEELLRKFGVYNDIQDGLSKMYQISARDTHTQEVIKNMTGREVPIVCDPVILYNGMDFQSNVKKISKPYMLVYAYDRNMIDPNEIRKIKAYAKRHGLITVSCGTYHKWCDKNIVCNAEEWYSFFKNAEVVLTDTFHGTVVAMKNHCNFAVFIRQSLNVFKLESLLAETGLESRRLPGITEYNMEQVFATPIDYLAVEDNISRMTQRSKSFLFSALEGIDHE